MFRLLWLSLAIGCSFDHGLSPETAQGDGGTTTDLPPATDAMTTPTADAQQCWSLAGLSTSVCLMTPPSGNVVVSGDTTIDTSTNGTGALSCRALVPGSSDVCVIAGQSITIAAGATLSASGDRPLVLIAIGTLAIDGELDVASHRGGTVGPGADLPGCVAGTPATSTGGGQGGSFGGLGGDGGNGAGANGSRGRAGNALSIGVLRGGCRGGAGGKGGGSGGGGGNGGAGGRGGGAVALVAGTIALAATARIDASGAGASGGGAGREGGGGAGSGGMIVLAAGSITVASGTQIFANGGHGGGGSDDEEPGSPGTDPTVSTGGSGGGAPDGAGSGAPGFPAMQRDGANGIEDGFGGGGGGGGAGVIKVLSPSSIAGAQVSPAPT